MSYQYSDNYTRQRRDAQRPRRPLNASAPDKPEVAPEHDHSEVMVDAVSDSREYKKFAAVVGVIFLCATIMSLVLGFDWQEWMRWFMAGTLVIFGSFKLIGYETFIVMFPTYDIIAKRFKLYNYFYPFIQLFLGFLYAANLSPRFRDIATFAISAIGAYGILKILPNSEAIRCACLGNVIKLPLSKVSMFEEITMAGMAAIMLVSQFIT